MGSTCRPKGIQISSKWLETQGYLNASVVYQGKILIENGYISIVVVYKQPGLLGMKDNECLNTTRCIFLKPVPTNSTQVGVVRLVAGDTIFVMIRV